MSIWPLVSTEQVAAKVKNALVGGPFGSDLVSKDYVAKGIPVVRGQNMSLGRWVGGDFVFVSEDKAESLKANLAYPGDLIFTQRGTLGQVALIPDSPYEKYLISQSQMKLAVNPEIANAKFLYYQFSSEAQQSYIQDHAISAGVPHTNLSILRNTPILLPPLEVQCRIAAILGSLDDKIELNRRMNETLEAMAQALFQSWFVDFDPVRVKARGGDPVVELGLSPQVAALFPDSFQNSGLGNIPSQWKFGSWLELGDLLSGGTPKTEITDYWNGDIPWVSAKDISQVSSCFIDATERSITKRGLDESSTKIIPELATIIIARGATTGRLAMIGKPMAMNQTCYALNSKIDTPYHLYCALKYGMTTLTSAAHGSIFDTITTTTFQNSLVVCPDPRVAIKFDEVVSVLFDRILLNLRETARIIETRDYLLPRLLSGEVSVQEGGLS